MPFLSTKDVGLSPDLRNKLATLGITADSFDDLIELIIETATKPTEVQSVSASTLSSGARTFGLGGGSSQAVKISDKTFSWESNDLTFSYNAENIKKSLPDGMTYVGANVTLTGKGRPSSARATAGSISLPDGVTQAKVNITANTEYGTVVLTKTFPVSANSSGSVILETDDLSAAPSNLSVQDHLELLSSHVARLEQKS